MKLLKQIFTPLLLALLLLPMVTPVILQVQQLYVQWQMLEALEEKELITVTVDAAHVQWIKKGKECIINGEMFDVKKSVEKNDQLILTGLFDKKEKQIKKRLAAQTQKQQNRQTQARFVKFMQQIAAVSPHISIISKSEQLPSNYSSFFKTSYYQSPGCKTATPPPECYS